MSLTPEIQGLLQTIQASGVKPFHQSTIEEARRLVTSFQTMQKPIEIKSKNTDIEYQKGTFLRVYQPANAQESLPVLVYYHGGGFVSGHLDVADESCHALAEINQHVVVSVDYRLAPEHPFPAAQISIKVAYKYATFMFLN